MFLDQRVMDEIAQCERSIRASLNDPRLCIVWNKIYRRFIIAKRVPGAVFPVTDMVAGTLANPNQPTCDLQGIFVHECDPKPGQERGEYLYPPGCEQIIAQRMKLQYARVGPDQVWKKMDEHNRVLKQKQAAAKEEWHRDVAEDCEAATRRGRGIIVPN